MRSLVEHSKDREVVLVDGVKVLHDDGWVLGAPDPEEPVTHVWAEAGSDTDARRLAQEYGRRSPDAALTFSLTVTFRFSCSVSDRERARGSALLGRPRMGEGRG